MDPCARLFRLRAFHGSVVRVVAGAVTATLLLLAVPTPAAAAPIPKVTITDTAVTEGTGAAVNASFTIQVAPRPATCCALQVSWATAPGSASAADFTSSSGTVSLTKTTTSRVVSVPVIGDASDEPTETFVVNLSNLIGSPGSILDAQGVATITDDDAPPLLSVNDTSVIEGNAGTTTATFTASLSAASANTVTFNWATAVGSATAGVDYVAASGSRTIAAGATSATIGITVHGDVLAEGNETFGITLSGPSNATIADGSGLATITDDDAAPSLSINDVAITEGNAGTTTATFTVNLSAASGKTVTLAWATAAGSATAGADFVAASGSRTIAAGATTTTIGITVNGDVLDEVDETFGITLSNPSNATIADGSGVGTITDDDAAPSLSINDVAITEGNSGTTTATFTVTLSAASGKTVTVGWATADDDATQPSDYTAGSGTLTFVPGGTSESIPVSVFGDVTAELDETFDIILATPSNATIADGSGLGTITDDELLAVVDIDEPTLVEGQNGTTSLGFSVMLSHQATYPVTVDWDTAPGTATEGTDYVGASGTVTFAPMDTSETVLITVNGDTTYERNETVMVDLSNGQGAPIGDVRGIGTITDDDTPPILSVANASITEGNTGTSLLHFTVSLTGTSDVAASVDYTAAGTTATAGSDFVATSGTLTIPAGMTSGSIDVVVNGDVAFESNETLSLTLTTPTDATLGDATALGTIVNTDKATTTLTLTVVRRPSSLIATGLLEPAKTGERVTATLYRKKGTRFVRVAAKTVSVRYFKDRDHDGKTDGSYTTTFVRPKAQGSYKIVVRFKGNATAKPSSRAKIFTLPAS
jgi:large repetitive protein